MGLDALVIVVGWPYLGSVMPAGPARVVLRHEHGAAGIDLASGERTREVPAEARGAGLLALRASRLVERQDRDGFVTRWRDHELRGVRVNQVIAGDDDHLVVTTSWCVMLVERGSRVRRRLAIPAPPDLGDVVTGGAGGQLDKPVLAVEPDYLVFVRSPALLAVRLPDVIAALRGDTVEWDLRVRLPLREGDRLWLPEGDAGRVTPPRDARVTVAVEHAVDADPDRPERVAWLADAGTLPAARAAKASPWAALARVEVPATAKAGIALARELHLDERGGAYGPVERAYEQLADLTSRDPDDADERRIDAYHDLLVSTLWHQGTIYDATPLAIPSLVGILRDPATLNRDRIAHTLALIAVAARDRSANPSPAGEDPVIADGVRLALRRCLPALLEPPPCPAHELDTWRYLLLAIAAIDGPPAPWFRRIAKRDPAARELLDRLADEELWDIVNDVEISE